MNLVMLRALGASLLCHLVLLSLFLLRPFDFSTAALPPAMQATLATPDAAAPESAPAAPPPTKIAVAKAPLPKLLSQVDSPNKLSAATPLALPEQAVPNNVRMAAAEAGTQAQEARRSPDLAPSEAVRVGLSAEGLRQYRYALAREARRNRQYPAIARSRGWEGTAEVVVSINGSGVPTVGLAKSSGFDVLDEQALAMMGRAVLVALLPEALRGYAFSVPVPVQFSLND